MRAAWGSVLAACGLIAGSAPLSAQDDPAPGTCYDTALGAWRTEQELDSLVYAVPPRILVGDSVVVDPRTGARRRELGVPEGGLPTPHRTAIWQQAADSVRVWWSTGFAGVRATLGPTRAGFRGEARTFSDVAEAPGFEAELALTRVPCFPLRWRAEDERPLLRAIRLANGAALRLLEPLDPSVPARQHRTGVWRFETEAAVPLDGVSHGYLQTTPDGRLFRIRLWYRDPGAMTRLEAALRAELGEPTWTRDAAAGEGSGLRVWTNRTRYVGLLGSPGGAEGEASLVLEHRGAR